jgi:hypothetical protein
VEVDIGLLVVVEEVCMSLQIQHQQMVGSEEVQVALMPAQEMVEPHQMMVLVEQMHFKILDLVGVVQVKHLLFREHTLEDLVVPESSLSLILHKYSKNIQWA